MTTDTNEHGLSLAERRSLANKKLGLKMVWIVVGSLVFAFALVPLYDVLCTMTGLNGKTDTSASALKNNKVDTEVNIK